MTAPTDTAGWQEFERLLVAGVNTGTSALLGLGVSLGAIQPDLSPHGIEHDSERGYQQHRYLQIPACIGCLQAHAIHNISQRSAVRAARRSAA